LHNGYSFGVVAGNQNDYDFDEWEDIDNIIGVDPPSNSNNNNNLGSPPTLSLSSITQCTSQMGGYGVNTGRQIIYGSGFTNSSSYTVEMFGIQGSFENISATYVSPTTIRFNIPVEAQRTVELSSTSSGPNPLIPLSDQYSVRVKPSNGSWTNTIGVGVLTKGLVTDGPYMGANVTQGAVSCGPITP
jgi:hypothetical protein